ncbi:hypothetical protein [Haliangium sp.]|uniref:hypothetical protein n=1 Tax=Haliangium sp. TaxID=2663208 RepID=UPI003D0DF2A9
MNRAVRAVSALAAALVALPGCPSREVSQVELGQERQESEQIPIEPVRDVDILFVIDNSDSMAEEQASLVENFPRFIGKLEGIDGGLPNIQIAVISTDMGGAPSAYGGCDGANGDDGTLQSDFVGSNAACSDGTVSLDPGATFLRDVEDPDQPDARIRNYSGMLDDSANLAQVFACMAELGIEGCGFEQPLEAMRRALEKDTGFLRPNAYLAVIFITDEDDCSAFDNAMFTPRETPALGQPDSFRCFEFGVQCNPDVARSEGDKYDCVPREDSPFMHGVDEYVSFLKGIKDPSQIIVAGIVGVDPDNGPVSVFTEERVGDDGSEPATFHVLSPACETQDGAGAVIGKAAPAVRLGYFFDQFGQNSTTTTICDQDLTDALDVIGNLLAARIGDPFCLTADVDLDHDPANGLQYDCQVSDVQPPTTADALPTETPVQECDAARSKLPCWTIELNEATCANEGGVPPYQYLVVERGDEVAPPNTEVVLRCALK